MPSSPTNYLHHVRAQYEQLPYPLRNPEDEKQRLNRTFGDDLEYLNHLGFSGKMPLDGFRVLDAGAGSGDGSVYLAEQLRELGGSVVHLDMSEASIGVARERARLRHLTNIEFVHASLLDIPALELGSFHYITCTGVLHHLADPKAGLEALLTALRPEGLIKIMLYGQYGRTWVYHMQELMRQVNCDLPPTDIDGQLARCKQMMAQLKGERWYTALEDSVNDIRTMGDVGIFDLFLHSQDRAYTIPQLYEFLASCGLTLQHYIPSPQRLDANTLPPDSPIRSLLQSKSLREQQSILELMHGNIKKHFCYATKELRSPPTAEDEQLIPQFSQMIYELEATIAAQAQDTQQNEVRIKVRNQIVRVPLSPESRVILPLIDGHRSTKEILDAATGMLAGASAERARLRECFLDIFSAFHQEEWIFLRHRSLPSFPSLAAMQERVSALYRQT